MNNALSDSSDRDFGTLDSEPTSAGRRRTDSGKQPVDPPQEATDETVAGQRTSAGPEPEDGASTSEPRTPATSDGLDASDLGAELTKLELVDPETLKSLRGSSTDIGGSIGLLEQLQRTGSLTAFQAQRIREGSVADIVFDDYLLVDKLGEGGMGEVFKARNRFLGRIEAIKTIVQQKGASEAFLARFKQEANVLARLDHPAIVPIYRVGRVGTADFIAMKFVEGVDLHRKVKMARVSGKQFSVEEVCRWISEAADALDHAHQHNIIHRDIKPHNLMLTDAGKIIVLDMGIARLALPSDSPQGQGGGLTMQGRGLGTPEFMPPEQWADATSVTPASDIYALGCTMYFLLTGKSPYARDSIGELLRAHAGDPIPHVVEKRPDVPDELDAIVIRMMGKRPEDRYSSAKEVTDALRPFGGAAPKRHGIDRSQMVTVDTSVPAPRKRNARWAVIVPLLLGLVVGGVWFSLRPPTEVAPRTVPIVVPPPEVVDLRAEWEAFLTAHFAKNHELWSDEAAFRREAGKSRNLTGPLGKAEFDALKVEIARLTNERQPELMEKPKPAPWLVAYGDANPKEWPDIDTLMAFIRQSVDKDALADPDRLLRTSGPLVAETTKRRQERLRKAFVEFISNIREEAPVLWPDANELNEFVDELTEDRPIDSESQLAEIARAFQEETARLRDPFANIDPRNLSEKGAANATTTLEALRRVISLHASDRDPTWKLSGGLLRKDEKRTHVQTIKVEEKVYLWFETNRKGHVTFVMVDPGNIFLHRFTVDDDRALGHELQFTDLEHFEWGSPGKHRFFLYASEQPFFESLHAMMKTQKDDPDLIFAQIFRTPRAFGRIVDSLENRAPFPGIPVGPNAGSWTSMSFEVTVEPQER